MAKLPDTFSIGHPVTVDPSGHPVRPVDVNGVALDDPTQSYSTAHPVIETDANGVVLLDSTKTFSITRKVRVDPTGTPVITVGLNGTALGTTLGIGGGGAGVSTFTYDTAIGNGVDQATGFTALPLAPGGVEGADPATAAPTDQSGQSGTYNSGTRTLTYTFTGPMCKWTNILTIGQAYHVVLVVNQSTSCNLVFQDESAFVAYRVPYGLNTASYLVDAVFTATGHDFVLQRENDGFAGTIKIVKFVAVSTAAVPARRFYVNPSTGSDSVDGIAAQNPSTPAASVKRLAQFVNVGRGDQIMLAEGQTFTNGLFGAVIDDNTTHDACPTSGKSPQYPFVIQSYNVADPTNEAKHGRATGSNRPIINPISSPDGGLGCSGGTFSPIQYVAIRGIDFNPTNVGGVGLSFLGTNAGNHNYFLWENCRFQYCQVTASMNTSLTRGYKWIFRLCSNHGSWDATGDEQWIYMGYVDGTTVEDCASWHAGWNESVARNASAASGGATIYSHIIYTQDDCRNACMRRNVIVDAATDGGRIKGGGLYQNNIVINTPIAVDNGGGNNYVIDAALGVYHDISGNITMGGGTVDGSVGSGWGWHTVNGRPGSKVHHNLNARCNTPGAPGALIDAKTEAFTDQVGCPAPYGLDCYTDFEYNTTYSWSGGAGYLWAGLSGTTVPGRMHYAENFNIWEDAASGNNVNYSSVTMPNTYTLAQLLTVANASYTSLSVAQSDWVNNPDKRGWLPILALAKTGYAVQAQTLTNLTTNLKFVIGTPSAHLLVGVLDGSTLTCGSLPTGCTLDSDCHVLRYDGTGTATTGTVTIRETDLSSNTHDTVLSWSRAANPTLSSLAITPGSTTTSATISTNDGSGTLFWAVTTSSMAWDWRYIRVGFDGTNGAVAYGQQAVSASGTQTINITGLSASTGYYLHVAQLGAGEGAAPENKSSFTTTAGVWTPSSPTQPLAAWYDVSDISTLFKDTAGTVPVTADGDLVARVNDKSGNGYHMLQATSGSRPTYKTSGGKSWLLFAGSQTMFTSGAATMTDGSGQHMGGIAFQIANTTGTMNPVDADGTNRVFQLRTNSGSSELVEFAGSLTVDNAGAVSANTSTVMTEKVTTTSAEVFVNGTGNGSQALTTPASATTTLALGVNQNSSSGAFSGRLYQWVHYKGVLSSGDHTSLVTYLTGKM